MSKFYWILFYFEYLHKFNGALHCVFFTRIVQGLEIKKSYKHIEPGFDIQFCPVIMVL